MMHFAEGREKMFRKDEPAFDMANASYMLTKFMKENLGLNPDNNIADRKLHMKMLEAIVEHMN